MGRSERPTLADVAAAAGVSVSTASLTFSGAGPVAPATRERVLASAAELGYTGPDPTARSLRRGRSGVIAVVVRDRLHRSFNDPVSTQVLDGVAQELDERGLGLLLVASAEFRDTPALVRHGAMDAAIIGGLSTPTDRTLVALRERFVPFVRIDASPRDGAGIGLEDRAGTVELVRHLQGLGHERIGVVTLPLGPGSRGGWLDPARRYRIPYVPTRNRWAGVLDSGVVPVAALEAGSLAAGDAGLEEKSSLVDEGIAAGRLLLTLPERPTAIVAFTDLLAAGVVLAARELGLAVPGDVSVAGFDGLWLPWLAPDQLTSVAQPLIEKGRLSARAAAALADGEAAPFRALPVTLREGTTTGPAPG